MEKSGNAGKSRESQMGSKSQAGKIVGDLEKSEEIGEDCFGCIFLKLLVYDFECPIFVGTNIFC